MSLAHEVCIAVPYALTEAATEDAPRIDLESSLEKLDSRLEGSNERTKSPCEVEARTKKEKRRRRQRMWRSMPKGRPRGREAVLFVEVLEKCLGKAAK